jgi:AraC family transcriptional regulator of adaptative response/methylated-DNA-[protein]-cysteine methyltransferase
MNIVFDTETARWDAVARRDKIADGHFVYSVLTTGVYCRPSCASRPKRRENVAFHASPSEAERMGYRPCRRCRPNEAPREKPPAGRSKPPTSRRALPCSPPRRG